MLAAFDAALAQLRDAAATVEEVELPNNGDGVPVYYLIATAEASSNLARYDGVRYGHRTADASSLVTRYERTRGEGFGPEVKRRIILGTFGLSSGYYEAYYFKAQQVRRLIARDYETAFRRVDVIALPRAPREHSGSANMSQIPFRCT